MKTAIAFIILLLIGSIGKAQFQTQQFVDNIPSLPAESCKIKAEKRDAFIDQVKMLQDQIDDQIKKMKSQSKADGSQAKENAINQMATQYGLSDEEVQKMKSKKMSAADKAALSDKMLQQQTNISMGEIKNMKGMSKDGKKAWAGAYGGEAYAMAQASQGKSEQQNTGTNPAELAQQLQNLRTQVDERRMNIDNEYVKIDTDPERMATLQKIGVWNSMITGMTGAEAGQGLKMDSITSLIRKEKEKYCEKYTPLYLKVLDMHYADLKASYTDYIRIADLNRMVANLQPIKVNTPIGPEIDYFKYIKGYLSRLSAAFNYSLK
jgi:tetrahydromethanopterin S-methyltransferase subunit B